MGKLPNIGLVSLPKQLYIFVSKAWGWWVSEQILTEERGILNRLLPGDFVLADRGFSIIELIESTGKVTYIHQGKSSVVS